MEILLEVWGDFACFTQPWSKVERLSAPFPTPSASRGILSSIYMKPAEFTWQINRIEVLNPIQYIGFKRNEVKCTVSNSPIYSDDNDVRTQRQTIALKDVRYRIAASILPRPAFAGKEAQLYAQALRRIRCGKAYAQPGLGLREFVGYFEESDLTRAPIDQDLDAGLMVYDIFDQKDPGVQKKAHPRLALYHAVMKKGVIQVPPYDSPEVMKGEFMC